jgi:predicted transcriptional regulator
MIMMDNETNGKAVWLKTLDVSVGNLDVKVDRLLEGQARLQERESRVECLDERMGDLEVQVNTLSNQFIQNDSEKTTKEKMNKLWLTIYVAAGTIIATIFGPIISRLMNGQ